MFTSYKKYVERNGCAAEKIAKEKHAYGCTQTW